MNRKNWKYKNCYYCNSIIDSLIAIDEKDIRIFIVINPFECGFNPCGVDNEIELIIEELREMYIF